MLEDDDERSKLQRRIDVELRQKTQGNTKNMDIDGVEDSAMLKGTKTTGKHNWFWAILIVLAILSLLVIFVLK